MSDLCYKNHPIDDYLDFIGRESIVKTIYEKVINGQQTSLPIVCMDGMGKTSLINYILSEHVLEALMEKKTETLLVRLSDTEPTNAMDFFYTVLNSTRRALTSNKHIHERVKDEFRGIYSRNNNSINLSELKDIIYEAFNMLTENHICTIIIIDDFERMTKCLAENVATPEKKQEAIANFGLLRVLINTTYKARILATSKKSITAISNECSVSGLPNAFASATPLELFNNDEIVSYLINTGLKPEENSLEEKFILNASGRVPAILRSTCAVLRDSKKDGYILDEKNYSEFVGMVVKHCEPLFDSYWRSISYEAQRYLKHLAIDEGITDIKKSFISVARNSLIEMKLINENGRDFLSEAFRYYAAKAPVINKEAKTPVQAEEKAADMEEAYKEFMQKAIDEAMVKVSQNIEKLGAKFQAAGESKDPKELIKEALTLPGDTDINSIYPTLKGRSVSKVWGKLDEDARRKLILAERYKESFYDADIDQADTCVKYGKIFEGIIKRLVMPVVAQKISEYHIAYKFRKKDGSLVAVDKIPKPITIGTLEYLLGTYVNYASAQDRAKSANNNDIIRIYGGFKNKLQDILSIRNMSSHDEEESEPLVNNGNTKAEKVSTVHLDLMVDQMLGKDEKDISGIEYLLMLSEMKIHKR